MAKLPAATQPVWALLKETFAQWEKDQASRLAASLALYTLLSIAPLIVVSIAVVDNARAPSAGIIGSVLGIAVLLFCASGVFGELQAALNQIWNVKQRPGRGLRGMLRDRSFSFTMVMGVAFLLLVSLVVSAVLTTVTTHVANFLPWPAITWRDVWVGAFVTACCFSLGKGALAWCNVTDGRVVIQSNVTDSGGRDEDANAWRVSKSSS